MNVYHESRSESVEGQHAVAQVTMNRAGRDPSKVCETVVAPKQFSWTGGLVIKRRGKMPVVAKAGLPTDKKAWKRALDIAMVTLNGWVPDYTGGATFYHTKSVYPYWRRHFELVTVIGSHKFYRL